MKIIFDLDHTLLNSKRLRFDFEALLAGLKIEAKKRRAASREMSERFLFSYAPEKHLEILENLGVNLTPAQSRKVNGFFKKSFSKYLNPGVGSILRSLRQAKYELVLLTRGDLRFQMLKIENAGLEKIFRGNIFITNDKTEWIRANRSSLNAQTWFVNDNWAETNQMRELLPEANFILFVRSDHKKFYKLTEIDIPKFSKFSSLPALLKKQRARHNVAGPAELI